MQRTQRYFKHKVSDIYKVPRNHQSREQRCLYRVMLCNNFADCKYLQQGRGVFAHSLWQLEDPPPDWEKCQGHRWRVGAPWPAPDEHLRPVLRLFMLSCLSGTASGAPGPADSSIKSHSIGRRFESSFLVYPARRPAPQDQQTAALRATA